jgi:hypothetical protein
MCDKGILISKISGAEISSQCKKNKLYMIVRSVYEGTYTFNGQKKQIHFRGI